MSSDYQHYTVGGYFASGKPIEGGEYGTLADAQEGFEYFAGGSKAYPVIYGWVDSDPCNAVQLS